jgi:hypothetical protein
MTSLLILANSRAHHRSAAKVVLVWLCALIAQSPSQALAETSGQSGFERAANEAVVVPSPNTPASRILAALKSMQLRHELRPAGVPENYGWKGKPSVGMGTEPYAASIRSTWPGRRFDDWHAMQGWFVIYETEGGSSARNSAVEIGGIEMWYLSRRDLTWRRLQSDQYPKWHGSYSTNAIDKSNEKPFMEKRPSGMVLAPSGQTMLHGGVGHIATPWNTETKRADLAAVFVSVKHRLVLKDATQLDDRAMAKLIVLAGADYYPYVGARLADLNAPSVPAIGLGRFLLATENWRYSTMIVVKEGISEEALLSGLPNRFDF